jgi:putative Ca2+/H+ antiporter (TMEM165/GDT1 family)
VPQELIEALWISFVTVSLAELGDKTQLLVLSLSMRCRFWAVWGGAVAAMAVLTLLAVALGSVVVAVVPMDFVETGAAIFFIVLGLWMLWKALRAEEEEEGEVKKITFWSVFALMFVAELGDKTQLMALGMTARFPLYPIAVFAGCALGLAAVTTVGVLLGKGIATRIPRKAIAIIAAIVFIAFGILSLLKVF